MLGALLLICYFVLLFFSLWQQSLPSISCKDPESQACVSNLVSSGDKLELELLLFLKESNQTDSKFRWTRVETCNFQVTLPVPSLVPTKVTSDDEGDSVCNVTLPDSARISWSNDDRSTEIGGPLRAKFRFRLPKNSDASSDGPIVTEVPFHLTRIVERTSQTAAAMWGSSSETSSAKARNLLKEPSSSSASEQGKGDEENGLVHTHIPFLKYGSQPIVIRYVSEEREYGGPPFARADGVQLLVPKWNRTSYRPIMYIDENALQRSAQRELAPPNKAADKPPIRLQIQLSSLSPMRDVFNQQISTGLNMAESMLPGGELDEIRYWLRDERLYRFFLTQLISIVHVWVDWLAFRDEVRFYRGKTNFVGVSVSSVITRLICSLIIFLYLIDGGGTSWVVLLSVFSGVAVDGWKAWKMLRPTWTSSFPFIKIRTGSISEQTTATYDRIAITYLGLFLYPVVIGWSIYALQHYVYTSWYSWLISNLANAVYTFGFIGLCPQLYVNYRLKSVAHLPWKVFLYKVFNTFVDDVFAFLIDMPWKHRIMTLRDDFVFIIFLIQAYLYRVDKSRTNEFGYAYEHEEEDTSRGDGSAKEKEE